MAPGTPTPGDPAWPSGLPAPPSAPLLGTPNSERYVLEADVMRRRQLRAALLHGSRRSWREQPRVWPAVVLGVVLVAVAIAAIAVYQAYARNQPGGDSFHGGPATTNGSDARRAGAISPISGERPNRLDHSV